MAGRKGMKMYPNSIRSEIVDKYQAGESVHSLSKKYCISRYAIQSWCGLIKNKEEQIVPKHRGRPRKTPITTQREMELRIKQLEMENELLRNFLKEIERG